MIKALEQAIEKVRRLSKERQEYAAEVLDSRRKRRRSMPELAPTVAPVYH